MLTMTKAAGAIVGAALLSGALASPVTADPAPSSITTAPPRITVDETITTGLTSPWGLAFLPDGSALVSERDTGRVKRIPAAGGRAVVVGKVRGAVPQGEGGLLGIAVPQGRLPPTSSRTTPGRRTTASCGSPGTAAASVGRRRS